MSNTIFKSCSIFNVALLALVLLCSALLSSPDSVLAMQEEAEARNALNVDNRVNINTADADTLALALDGVGMTRALDIVAYREEHGNFQDIDDLQRVRGIGSATLERNRERIVLDGPEEAR